MQIIHVGTELTPVAKVGGLGDVLLGLSRELLRKGHSVRVILPKYDCLVTESVAHLQPVQTLSSQWEGKPMEMEVWKGEVESIPTTFLRSCHPKGYFDRECIYGSPDDTERFLHFCRMVYDYLTQTEEIPDILHLHDWQASALALLFREDPFYDPSIVFTIHNLAYQGITDPEAILSLGIEHLPPHLEDPKEKGKINLMKGGILYSDFLNTVSPSYAREILTPEGGKNLDAVLRSQEFKFQGILNGIDDRYWNPETDRYLTPHFSSRINPFHQEDRALFQNKTVLKDLLRQRVGLRLTNRPLIACVTRLVPQKGIDLIKHAIHYTISHGGQFLLLGTTNIPSIFEEFQQLQQELEEHPDAKIVLRSPEDLVHQIYAGADLFIVPSLFEPCGLTQLISLRYGTIPIVRATGGLKDTVFDVDHTENPEGANGFTFLDPTPSSLEEALERALQTWNQQPDRWQQLALQAMKMDYSWKRSCMEYLEAYAALLLRKAGVA